MSPEKQRIAIAEACGWKFYKESLDLHFSAFSPDGKFAGLIADYCGSNPLPDYLNDLNAMHEAEKTLTEIHHAIRLDMLLAIVARKTLDNASFRDWMKVANATAAQRAEAFLRTIGKWEES